MKEKSLWSWLSKARNFYQSKLLMWRVENAAGMGMPDVEGVLLGKWFAIELKVAKRPKRSNTKIRIRFQPSQLWWHKRLEQAEGLSYILIQVEQDRYLIPGQYIDQLNEGLTELQMKNLSVAVAGDDPSHIIKQIYLQKE